MFSQCFYFLWLPPVKMERTPVPPLDVDFVTYREDLKLPSLEDFRVFWHAQMLAAQRYMTVVNEKYSLALHLSQDLQSKTLETNIRREFSSPKPRIVGSSKSPHLSWSDLIKETTDSSFTQENEDLFSCLVRGQKVELSAADCKRVNACRTLSILPPSPQNDINTERETISEVRKFISQCQKDREDGKFFRTQILVISNFNMSSGQIRGATGWSPERAWFPTAWTSRSMEEVTEKNSAFRSRNGFAWVVYKFAIKAIARILISERCGCSTVVHKEVTFASEFRSYKWPRGNSPICRFDPSAKHGS